MKTGILGGTFNPIHNAHLLIAEACLESCGLDRVLFLPAATPPHKDVAGGVSFAQRLAMVECAIADHPRFFASDLEAQRDGVSFSVDTLARLQKLYPQDDLYFIIGLDSFRDITTWKDYARLFSLANIVVACRPGEGDDDPRRFLPVAVEEEFCYDERSLNLRHKSGHELIFVNDTRHDISSTGIRERIARREPVTEHLPPGVGRYIEANNLYRNTTEDND